MPPAFKTGVGHTLKHAWNKGVVLGQHIVVSAFGEFGSYTKATAALIEIAAARYVFVVNGEAAVVVAFWRVATSRA